MHRGGTGDSQAALTSSLSDLGKCVYCSAHKAQGSSAQSRRQRLNQIHAVEMALCEPQATRTTVVPFISGFPPYSLSKCVLGWVWKRPGSGNALVFVPRGPPRLWEKPSYAWINHQAETGITTARVRARRGAGTLSGEGQKRGDSQPHPCKYRAIL